MEVVGWTARYQAALCGLTVGDVGRGQPYAGSAGVLCKYPPFASDSFAINAHILSKYACNMRTCRCVWCDGILQESLQNVFLSSFGMTRLTSGKK